MRFIDGNGCGIVRIHMGFSNFNYMLTNLRGEIITTINGGGNIPKRTRMITRHVGDTMDAFLASCSNAGADIRYVKILFTGPSKRFRSKLISQVRLHPTWSVVCLEESFVPGQQGKRLCRRKR